MLYYFVYKTNFGPPATFIIVLINSANIECKKKAQFIIILMKEKNNIYTNILLIILLYFSLV